MIYVRWSRLSTIHNVILYCVVIGSCGYQQDALKMIYVKWSRLPSIRVYQDIVVIFYASLN